MQRKRFRRKRKQIKKVNIASLILLGCYFGSWDTLQWPMPMWRGDHCREVTVSGGSTVNAKDDMCYSCVFQIVFLFCFNYVLNDIF